MSFTKSELARELKGMHRLVETIKEREESNLEEITFYRTRLLDLMKQVSSKNFEKGETLKWIGRLKREIKRRDKRREEMS